jgi:hypothetical protein
MNKKKTIFAKGRVNFFISIPGAVRFDIKTRMGSFATVQYISLHVSRQMSMNVALPLQKKS